MTSLGFGCFAAYAAPELGVLTVKYGTIYILGNRVVYQETVNFMTGLSPTPPQGIGGGLATVTKWAYERYLKPYVNK
jgi:hypothetical protein